MSTRPEPGTPEELIWLRGYEAGVINNGDRLEDVEIAHGSLILDMADLCDAISALLPDECWVSRTVGINCTDFIGGRLGNAEFTEEMCCLPCRIRTILNKGE